MKYREHKFIFFLLAFNFVLRANTPCIVFKENKGQWPSKVLFGTEFLNTKFYVNKNSFNYCVYNYSEIVKLNVRDHKKKSIIHGHNYEVNFNGADLSHFIKKEKQPDYYNYILGNDRNKWVSMVKGFKSVEFKNIYEGIDLEVYSTENNLKYDFVISPQANPDLIKLNYNYTDGIEIRNSKLIIKSSVGEITEQEPFTYQIINGKKKQVACKYVLANNNTVGFTFPNGYDKSYVLIIDPIVIACSYSGSSISAYNMSATYDNNGNIYNYGSADFGYPVTVGAFQITSDLYGDNFVSAYNYNGSTKLFSTYIGGDSLDFPMEILVKNNEIVLLGLTNSQNYPYPKTAYDTLINGASDLVISKLNITGTTLLASTFIGGSGREPIKSLGNSWGLINSGEMVIDTSGNVYAISSTASADFPTTVGAFSSIKAGPNEVCVFKFNSTLTSLIWSTYLGGNNSEDASGLRLDGTGGVYCFGTTNSTNFPTTIGTIGTTKTGVGFNYDFFVSHLNSVGNALIASTYIGTIGNDRAELMDIDQNNDIYICGTLSSAWHLTVTPGYYSNASGLNAIYKINSSLTNIIFKTKFGTTQSGNYPCLGLSAFKVDSCQNIYVAGFSYNTLPTTANQIMPFGGGYTDMYMAVFGSNCSSLKFASFYGGNSPPPTGYTIIDEQVGGISQFDNRGTLYLAINSSGNLPTTSNAFAPLSSNTTTNASIYNDAFLKVDMQTFVNSSSSYGANVTGCQPYNANFVNVSNIGTTYWDLGDGTTSTLGTIAHTYTNIGTYNVLLIVTDTATCNKTDSIKSILSIINPTSFNLGEDMAICLNVPTILQPNTNGVSYYWSTGQTTQSISVDQPGNYMLILNNGGCNTSDDINLVIAEKKLSERFPNVITPNNDGVNDIIDFSKYNFDEVEFIVYDRWGREHYKMTNVNEQWNPNDLINGTYFYIVSYKSNCTGESLNDKGFISVFK